MFSTDHRGLDSFFRLTSFRDLMKTETLVMQKCRQEMSRFRAFRSHTVLCPLLASPQKCHCRTCQLTTNSGFNTCSALQTDQKGTGGIYDLVTRSNRLTRKWVWPSNVLLTCKHNTPHLSPTTQSWNTILELHGYKRNFFNMRTLSTPTNE